MQNFYSVRLRMVPVTFSYLVLWSCTPSLPPAEKRVVHHPAAIKNAVHQQENKSSTVKPDITGTWAAIGEENATFIVNKRTFFYPEHQTYYKYNIKGDSIVIHYDDYTASFGVKLKGKDSMQLSSPELGDSNYYRFKN